MGGTIIDEQKRGTRRFVAVCVRDWFVRCNRASLASALSQALGQSVGLISGLIYVRLMPIDQYALYAMGLTSLTFVSIGSDLGLTGSINYFWRESSRDGCGIEPIIAAIQRLRLVFL